MHYICIQVQQLTQSVAMGMIEHPIFFAIGQMREAERNMGVPMCNREETNRDKERLWPDPETSQRASIALKL